MIFFIRAHPCPFVFIRVTAGRPSHHDRHRRRHHVAAGEGKAAYHIALAAQGSGLPRDSVILLEQIRTLDKKRLRERMGRVDSAVMEKVDAAIAVSFGLTGSHLV